MGKSKKNKSQLTKKGPSGGSKDKKGQSGLRNVFQVKTAKANRSRHKTKAVTTTLSKVINQTKGLSAMKINSQYSELQDTLHKSSSVEEKNKIKAPSIPQGGFKREDPVNIEEAVMQLSSL